MHRTLLFILLLACGPLIAGEIDQPAAVAALASPGTVLIDVRSAEEYAQGALPGAHRVETGELGERIGQLVPDKETPVVLYCRSGRRAAQAQTVLEGLGYRHVINGGGFDDLRAALRTR